MSETGQADRSKRHWVLVEKVSIDKGKEGLRFIEIPPESQTLDNGKERIFSARAFKLAYIGNVYTIDAAENTCWPDTLQFVSKWYDATDVAEWQAKARAFEVRRRMSRIAREAGKPEELQSALEPIRRAYRKTDATGRIALEATVLYFLRYGSTSALIANE